MSDQVHSLVSGWSADKPVEENVFAEIENALNVELPRSYKLFLSRHGSGEAALEDGTIVFYAPSDLLLMHREQGSEFPAANLLLFGGDGGGEAFAFNLQTRPCRFVMVPFIGNYQADRIDLGAEIDDLFDYPRRLGTGIA